jgi:fatty acid desaturase
LSIAPAITDPVYRPAEQLGPIDRRLTGLLNDPRDLPFLRFIARANLTIVPFAIYLFWPGRFSWWLAVPYLAPAIFLMGPFVLMLHNTCHRPLFRKGYRFLNHYIPWCLGPLFGETPDTYFAHHVGMHHPENNLRDDLSSTMVYRRDSFVDFVIYFGRFFFGGIFELSSYHVRRGRLKLLRNLLAGELLFYLAVAALAWWNWQATTVVLVAPFLICRFSMMAGNWAQHAFIDPASPENPYRNSITVINCLYNRRCFNDGYHIGHHIRPTRHWTEMPVEFTRQADEYARQDAIVFQGIDFFGVWACLMLKRYDWLARRYVPLGDRKRSREDVIALLHQRTRPIAA